MSLRAQLSGVPPREQAQRLAAVAVMLLARLRRLEPDTSDGEAALAAIRGWGDGASIAGRIVSDLVYSDAERGLLRRLGQAAGKPSEGAWNALTTATMYVAWLVCRDTGEPMPGAVNEVDEETLDLLDEQLAELA